MIKIGYICDRLQNQLINMPSKARDLVCPAKIEILDTQGKLHNDCLYICSESISKKLGELEIEDNTIIMFTDGKRPKAPANTVSIYFSCPLSVLFNTISLLANEALRERKIENESLYGYFTKCWEDIMSKQISGNNAIKEALRHAPYPVYDFIRPGIICFDENKDVDYRGIIEELRDIFKETNITVYGSNIVVLLSHQERQFSYQLPEKELNELLKKYNANFILGNASRDYNTLYFVYQLLIRALWLATKVSYAKGKRIFTYEQYSVYLVMDLCAQKFKETYSNDDIIYLAHPATIHLLRYDKAHKTNLHDVLYYYLLNNKNVGKTAASLYMHRNTVLNKLDKILELVKLDLNDNLLCQRLIISGQIIRYYETVMGLDIKL